MKTAVKTNTLIDMKPDISDDHVEGYSFDMLEKILSPAEFTSLHFFVSGNDIGIYRGQTFVYSDVYKRWASSGF